MFAQVCAFAISPIFFTVFIAVQWHCRVKLVKLVAQMSQKSIETATIYNYYYQYKYQIVVGPHIDHDNEQNNCGYFVCTYTYVYCHMYH